MRFPQVPSVRWPVINLAILFLFLGITAHGVLGQAPQPAMPNLVFNADENWKVVDMSNLDIACVEFLNEQEWGFFHPKSRLQPQTQQEFDAKYQTPAAMAKAWGMPAISAFSQIAAPENLPSNS